MSDDIIAEGRRLLGEATPRPWVIHERFPEMVRGPDNFSICSTDDASLIAFAVNNLAALLDCAEFVNDIFGLIEDYEREPFTYDPGDIEVFYPNLRASIERLHGKD